MLLKERDARILSLPSTSLRACAILAILFMTAILVSACAVSPVSTTPKDTRQFAVYLAKKAGEEDWRSIRELLVPEFQKYNENALSRALNWGGSLSKFGYPSFTDPTQWMEEQHKEFTIVRVINMPSYALVLRAEPSGSWRLDPGPYALALAEVFQQGFDFNDIPPISYQRQLITDSNSLQANSRYDDSLLAINANGNAINITIEVLLKQKSEIAGASEARVALSGLSWTAGNKSDDAKVVWTTAAMADDLLVFPGSAAGSPVYFVTFGLENVPEVAEIELRLSEIALENLNFSVRYVLPKEQYPKAPTDS